MELVAAFGSKPLTKFIQQAVDHNPTLEAAEAAIRVAHFTAEAQKAPSCLSFPAVPIRRWV